MTDIVPSRTNIQQEEVAYKAAVSEATGTRVGGAINFINRYQHDSHDFKYNGLYRTFTGIAGADGVFFCLTPIELIGCAMWNRVSGSSSNTTIDVDWYSDATTNEGTIFSTQPSIASTASDNAYFIYDAISNTDVATGTGVTPARFSTTRFAAGSILVATMDSGMPDAEDLCLRLFFRPINASEV